MSNNHDPLFRRDFLKTLGVAALPMLAQGCDTETVTEEFRAGPKYSKTPSKSGGGVIDIKVRKALLEQDLLLRSSQYCSLPAKYGYLAEVGQQVRITNGENNSAGMFTVAELRESDDDTGFVRCGLLGRARCGTMETFDGTLSSQCTASLGETAAVNRGEFIERFVDKGDGLLVLGCHGGEIENFTDMQAELVTELMSQFDASSWVCKGWGNGIVDAFKRWHISSTRLDTRSFPGLAKITNRDYRYCVSFHGTADLSGVLIGGRGPLALKGQMAEAIRQAVNGDFQVAIATDADYLNGDDPLNIVNRFTPDPGGIQLEQCFEVRTAYWEQIAEAVAGVFAQYV